jgi:hypothetical protein
LFEETTINEEEVCFLIDFLGGEEVNGDTREKYDERFAEYPKSHKRLVY